MSRFRSSGRGAACLVAIVAGVLWPPGAAADTISMSESRLPSPRAGTSAVWTGEHVFLFGGVTNPPVIAPPGVPVGITNEIVRFTPATGEVRTMRAKLPGPRWGTSAVWDGSHAYVFGGCVTAACDDVNQDTAEIARYDPFADETRVVGFLPSRRHGTSAVWAGDAAYVFGGRFAECVQRFCDEGHESDQILRYAPGGFRATPTGASMPGLRSFASAVWTGAAAYVVGDSTRMVRYEPSTDTATVVESRLPYGPLAGAAVWDGGRIFVFGGIDGSRRREIVRYDPASNADVVMSSRLPQPHSTGSAVWDGRRAWILGGVTGNGIFPNSRYSDLVLTYDPTPILPTAPVALQAAPGPERGQITLSWSPPSHHDDITSYRVYRGDALVAEVAGIRTFTDAGLPDGESFSYRVSAVNVVGEGPRTGSVSQRTPTLPGAPLVLSADPGPRLGEITLAWRPPQDTGGIPVRYRVLHGESPSSLEPVATVDAPGFVDRGLPNGVIRHFRVEALNDVGAGPLSDPASATTPTVPTAPRETAAAPGPGRGEITLRWNEPQRTWGDAVSYEVFADGSLVATVGARTFKEAGLPDGAVRGYAVRAVGSLGAGPFAADVTAHAPRLPSAVAGLTAAPGRDRGQILLRWEADAHGGVPVDVYRIYRTSGASAEELVREQAGTFTRWVDTDLEAGVEYRYRVDAVNLVGAGPLSEGAASSPQTVPNAAEQAAVVLLGGTAAPSADVTVRNGGTVVFVALGSGLNPRDEAGDRSREPCFDYRLEHGRPMLNGDTYRLTFGYDANTGALRVSTDGGVTFRDCPAGTGRADPEHIFIPYLFGAYYEQAGGAITVKT